MFSSYSTSVLFQVVKPDDVNESDFNLVADTEVLGFSIPVVPKVTNISMPIRITLQSLRGRREEVSRVQIDCILSYNCSIFSLSQPFFEPVCVSWDFNAIQKGEEAMKDL